MNRFQDKVVIVTGGGSGIGRATGIAFAREGACVVITDIVESEGRDAVATIEANGGTAHFLAVDVSQRGSVESMVQLTVSTFGHIDVYFSNAGVSDGLINCTETSEELWTRTLAVNLSGCFHGARAVFPHLMKTKGNIVMTASIASMGGMAGGPAYTASKYGVAGLVNQLGCEFAAHGVRVNAVAPGGVLTKFVGTVTDEAALNEYIKSVTPLGRWGTPEEIAAPVLFLASEEASYITGTLLRVDGGWRSK